LEPATDEDNAGLTLTSRFPWLSGGAPPEIVVLQWTNFTARYPHAHVLVGRTRNIAHWRSSAVLKLIKAQNASGQFSLRRTLDDEQGYWQRFSLA
jgi:hypothetical protein